MPNGFETGSVSTANRSSNVVGTVVSSTTDVSCGCSSVLSETIDVSSIPDSVISASISAEHPVCARAKEMNKAILMVLLNKPVFLILLITVCPFSLGMIKIADKACTLSANYTPGL